MKETIPDKFGRQVCVGNPGRFPAEHPKAVVVYDRPWDFNCPPGQICLGEYRLRCPVCGAGYVCDTEELKRHFNGVNMAAKAQEVEKYLQGLTKELK